VTSPHIFPLWRPLSAKVPFRRGRILTCLPRGAPLKKDLVGAAGIAQNSGASAFDVFTQEVDGVGRRKGASTLHCSNGIDIPYSVLLLGEKGAEATKVQRLNIFWVYDTFLLVLSL